MNLRRIWTSFRGELPQQEDLRLKLLHFRTEDTASPETGLSKVIPGHFNRRRQPVIICGTHGGGTSFLTKMLRYCGLFVGHDVEPFKARKFHESESFRAINILLFEELGGDKHGMNDQFIRDYISNFNNGELRTRMEAGIESKLMEAKERFSAGDSTVFERPWGWKDPRNSVNLHFWLRHFPEAKILMVKKEERNKRSRSVSGKWFRESTDFQREFYYNPRPVLDLDRLAANRILTIQFEDITSRQETFDIATGFCGLDRHPLSGVLKACRYEE